MAKLLSLRHWQSPNRAPQGVARAQQCVPRSGTAPRQPSGKLCTTRCILFAPDLASSGHPAGAGTRPQLQDTRRCAEVTSLPRFGGAIHRFILPRGLALAAWLLRAASPATRRAPAGELSRVLPHPSAQHPHRMRPSRARLATPSKDGSAAPVTARPHHTPGCSRSAPPPARLQR